MSISNSQLSLYPTYLSCSLFYGTNEAFTLFPTVTDLSYWTSDCFHKRVAQFYIHCPLKAIWDFYSLKVQYQLFVTNKVAFNVSLFQYDFVFSIASHTLFRSLFHKTPFASPMTFPSPFTSFIDIHLKLFQNFTIPIFISLVISTFDFFATQFLKESFLNVFFYFLPILFQIAKMTRALLYCLFKVFITLLILFIEFVVLYSFRPLIIFTQF